LKYCSRSEPSLENCGSPTLRVGEVFSLSFCPRHPAAWPAAFQVMFKNKAEYSFFKLLCNVFSKNFQSSMPFVWFLMFISFHQCGITLVVSSFRCMPAPFMRRYSRDHAVALGRFLNMGFLATMFRLTINAW
jgi:hypothetical protein